MVLTVASAAAFVGVYQWTVWTQPGRLVGDASLRGAMLTNSRISGAVDGVLGVVSVASLLGAVAAIAVIALIRLRRTLGLAAIALLAVANVTTWVLKRHALVRPDLGLRELTPATLNSLPSGHTTAAFSTVAALLFVLPGRWRGPVAAVGAGYACATAVATMSAGWHRAGDSLAAFLLVGTWVGIAGLVVVLGGIPVVTEPTAPVARPRWPTLVATGSLLAGLAIAAVLYLNHQRLDGTAAAVSAFTSGGLLIVGTATSVLIGVLAALDRITHDLPAARGTRGAVAKTR